MFANFDGTRRCKQRYRDLHCAYLYPKCGEEQKELRPCKSDCQKFVKECPGALLSCESFPDSLDECYETSSGFRASVALVVVFIGIFVALLV